MMSFTKWMREAYSSNITSGAVADDWLPPQEEVELMKKTIKEAADKVTDDHKETFLRLRISELEEKLKQLESFIEVELGVAPKSVPVATDCSSPVAFCSSCGCGKREMIEAKTKDKR